MDWALIVMATVFFGFAVNALCQRYLRTGKAKREKREVGYPREEIHINATDVPAFKPAWRDMGGKGEAS
jgi:hypothetical protein